MDCQTVHDHLSIYLDHGVPLRTRLVLDQHLESCPQCCHELARLHTITAWVRDFPLIEPSPMFLQHVREQVERLPHRSKLSFFRRLAGALPLQVAAALLVVVSAALVWQMTPHVQQGQVQEANPPATSSHGCPVSAVWRPCLTRRLSNQRSRSFCRPRRPWYRLHPDGRDSWCRRRSCASGTSFQRYRGSPACSLGGGSARLYSSRASRCEPPTQFRPLNRSGTCATDRGELRSHRG